MWAILDTSSCSNSVFFSQELRELRFFLQHNATRRGIHAIPYSQIYTPLSTLRTIELRAAKMEKVERLSVNLLKL